MPSGSIVLNIVATAMAVVGLWALPKVWHGVGQLRLQRAAAVWFKGESAQRAFIRGSAAAILGWPWLVVALWSLDVHKYGHGGLSRLAGLIGIIATILFVVIALGLNLTAALFNRPKVVVPPPFRQDPGILAARRKVPE